MATMAKTEGNDNEADNKQLVELVEDLRRSNAELRAETETFERYVRRLGPREPDPQLAPVSVGTTSQMETGAGRGRKSSTQGASQEPFQYLTLDQKYYICMKEVNAMRQDLEQLNKASEQALQNHKAMIQVTDKQLADIKKARYEFERDIVKPLREEKGVMVRPEKVIRYIEDRIKARDSLVEKLHLKNTALCAQTRKLQLQLLHKEDMEEVLHEVDFQQLRIENRQHLEHIDECNQDLLHLKLLAGNTQKLLNTYKKKLESLTSESKLLSSDIASHEDLLLKTDKETQQAEEERAKIEVQNKKLQAQLEDFSAPHVLEYMEARALHSQLEQSVKTWRRKIEVAEMTLKSHTKAWNRLHAKAGAPVSD
ncbi:coiled-coil domain-containing protein 113 [Electrophorus electricus]|uniref:coiled-coil domain-containing protein 113 n=1 Tax=Electrophorus electricus TaxID=8005 RepID=UPI0015D0AE66|nr:coiled-coil domain-containing protein 113 [Electrophorus electricus]